MTNRRAFLKRTSMLVGGGLISSYISSSYGATIHIKDDKAIGASGKIDFKAIFNQAYANDIKDWYVEVEEYNGTPQEDVKQSYDFLANAAYVK